MDTRACPVCGETIKTAALKCRFCNTDLQVFAENQSFETEKELFSGRPSAIYTVSQLFSFIIAIALCAALVYFGVILSYALLMLAVLCVTIGLIIYIKRWSRRFNITTQRIKVERGFLSKVEESLEVFRIDHFELRRPLGQRLLGGCSLRLFSSDAEFSNFYIYGIPQIEILAEQLRACQLRERKRRVTTLVRA
jgi:membrane protein YdbS with pleckstrin-like domain